MTTKAVPVDAIEKILAEVMERAVENGANSISMPDEYVEVAAWLSAAPAERDADSVGGLTERITAYLSGGGLFNPELANHDAVRDLLIDCRDALANKRGEIEQVRSVLNDERYCHGQTVKQLKETASQMLAEQRSAKEQAEARVKALEAAEAKLAEPCVAASTGKDSQESASSSMAWLIERGINERQSPTIWWRGATKPKSGMPYLGQWTENANWAFRLASRESAEKWAVEQNVPIPYSITQHTWLGSPESAATGKEEGGREMTPVAAELPEAEPVDCSKLRQKGLMYYAEDYDALRTFCQQQAATIERLRGEVARLNALCDERFETIKDRDAEIVALKAESLRVSGERIGDDAYIIGLQEAVISETKLKNDLGATVAMLRAGFNGALHLVGHEKEAKDQLSARVKVLEAALNKYGQHRFDCSLSTNDPEPCTCGLIEALKEPTK